MGFGDKAISEEPLPEMASYLTGIKKKMIWLQEDRDLWKDRALKAKETITHPDQPCRSHPKAMWDLMKEMEGWE